MPKKMRVKEYEDDPECRYIVIDDPWPSNRVGADRNAKNSLFFPSIGVWVYYMLEKQVWPEIIYSMNTRSDVVVRLPEDVNIEPILGAHIWQNFLNRNDVGDRVSYVFEYNYQRKGHPAEHQWTENYPKQQEPPPEMRFPVKFPYPSPSWATPMNKSCKDIALPLPSTRVRTPPPPPPPEPSVFEPNEPLVPNPFTSVAEGTNIAGELKQEEHALQAGPGKLWVSKLDPYEQEEVAFEALKQEPADHVSGSAVSVEQQPIVKKEGPSDEQEPSADLMAAFEELKRSRAVHVAPQEKINEPARKEPSAALLSAIAELQRARPVDGRTIFRPPSNDQTQLEALSALRDPGSSARANIVTSNSNPGLSSVSTGYPLGQVKSEPQDFEVPPLAPSNHLHNQETSSNGMSGSNVSIKTEHHDARLSDSGYDRRVHADGTTPDSNLLERGNQTTQAVKPEPEETRLPMDPRLGRNQLTKREREVLQDAYAKKMRR